jgi:enoyl-[acyl-carrier protein] reductase II
VVHVVSNLEFAKKSEEAGVDAIVCEGFEAGGHNGKEEITSMCLIPNVSENINIPVIAAGGIGSGKAMLAAFSLGAEGVQIGSRFVASQECSAHTNFKDAVVESKEGDTMLSLKKLTAVRLLNNEFYQKVVEAENRGDSIEELRELLGRGRSKRGMFEGNLQEGELEIGQVSSMINEIKPVKEIIDEIISDFKIEKEIISKITF